MGLVGFVGSMQNRVPSAGCEPTFGQSACARIHSTWLAVETASSLRIAEDTKTSMMPSVNGIQEYEDTKNR